ncbi:hypothetical protein ACFQ9Z_14525 [Streptomyces sp. NPDC056580]|uniref:hypothetical protein n=1 Tax=Streptomyces sp. NPDC056580 TaxID=3345872 RepID=UPI0036A78302
MDRGEHNGLRGVSWLLIAVVALGGGVATASEVRSALRRERAYRVAPVCASVPVRPSACVWRQTFTVRTADLHRGERNESPEARLSLPSGRPWRVTFRQTGPVASELEPGDTVVGLIWHGRVVEVRDAGGRRQQTSDGPVGWPEDRLGGALACGSFGLAALVGAVWSLFARDDRRHARAASVVRWHGAGMAVAALLTLWAQSANDWPMWSIPAIWGPLALLALASTVAFAVAAVRGDLDDEAVPRSARRVPPPPEPAGAPGGKEGPGGGHP